MKGSYDHPNFTVRREARLNAVQGAAASLTDFAHFRSRNKCIVDYVTVHCTSLPSAATSWSLQVMRTGATGTSTHTIAAKTITSFSVVGNLSAVITLTSSNTLATLGAFFALEMDGTEKGKFDVCWEYRILPSETA